MGREQSLEVIIKRKKEAGVKKQTYRGRLGPA